MKVPKDLPELEKVFSSSCQLTANGVATKDTENGNDEEECYDNDNGSDTKINKGHKDRQRQWQLVTAHDFPL